MSQRNETIECVVFDLGGVLIDWNPRHLYRKLFTDELEMERFLTEVCHGSWNEQQDAGRTFAEGTEMLVRQYPEQEAMIRAFFARWPEMVAGDIKGTVQILENLHASGKYKLLALSNWSAETFPHARHRFPFFDLFEAILLSGEEKMIKPDPKFYQLLSSRHGIDPAKSVFIDDAAKNIEAAKQLGFKTVHFKSPEALHRELMAFGIELN